MGAMDAMATKRQNVSSSCNALQFRILVAVAVFVVVCFLKQKFGLRAIEIILGINIQHVMSV